MIERLWIGHRSGLLLGILVLWCAGANAAFAQTQADFFDDTVLQEVRIVISSRDWQTLKAHPEENTYYPADLTWSGVTVRNIGIRSRGGATRNGIKPGLRVDINRYISNQEFLGLKAFSLDNMYSDSSLVRESVTMKMFEKMKLPASREAHARVYVNNEYAGAYVIIEAIDRTFVGRMFGAEEANVESGGYLFEYQWTSPYYLEYLGPGLEAYAALFKPQTRDTDSIVNIYAPIEEMIRTINGVRDEDFAAAVSSYLDLDVFMKYIAIDSFLADYDGFLGFYGVNNFYFYRFENTTRSTFIAWDKSEAFKGGPAFGIWHNITDVAPWYRNRLMDRAVRNLDLRDVYLDALLKCAEIASSPASAEDFAGPGLGRRSLQSESGWLEEEIVREYQQIRSAALEDPFKPYTNEQFEASIQRLLAFARARSQFVHAEVMRERR